MGRSTVHYADNETNNILKRLHNKLRPAGTPVERVEYIIELLLLRIFEAKLKQDEIFKPLRKLFEGENYRLLFSYIYSLSNGDRILSELNKTIFPFYASILQEARKVVKGNLPPNMQDQLVLMEEVFANSNFTNNVKGGVITEVIGLVNEIDEKYILKTDLLGDAIESALSETGGTKDLGLYRTPDHIRRMMVEMVNPDFRDTIFDPACGTAGFLFDAYDYVIEKSNKTSVYPSTNVSNMFYRTGIGGIEYQGRIRKMAAVNMYIRGLNPHNIRQGDSLKMFDPAHDSESKTVVIANPPFGAERDQPAYPNVWEEYSKESETTILFVKLMFDLLRQGGRCAVVVSEGFLTWGQGSACALRKLLLNEANLRAIISLPQGVFVSKSGQGAKTSVLYFEKGQPTDFVWYYKIENDGFSMGTNRKPIEGSQISELLSLFDEVRQGIRPQDTAHSFCINREQIETLDPRIEKRIKQDVTENLQAKNAIKREKKIAELDKKLAGKKISKTIYDEELSQFDSNLEAQIENEIAKAIEKAHTYHFNLQNYRSNLTEEQKGQILKLLPDRNINPADALHIDLLREYLQANADKLTPELKKVDEILRETNKYSFESLNNLLFQKSKKIILDDNTLYKQVTIKLYGKGILLRQEIVGADIKTEGQFIINSGDLIMSKIDARNGAFGIVPSFLNNAVVTSSFPYFEIQKEKVNPKYLESIITQKRFYEQINNMVSGATGRRSVDVKDVLSLQIPLPPLEIQNEIVEKIEKQKQIIEGAEKIEAASNIDYDIFAEYEKKNIEKFADINPSKQIKISENDFVTFIPMEAVDDISGKITKPQERPLYEVKKGYTYFADGDVIFAKITPCMENGKTALAENLKNGIGFGSTEFHVFRTNPNKLIAKYIYYFLRTKKFRELAKEKMTGASGHKRVPESFLKEYVYPLPPLEIQRQIVEKLDRQMEALESVRFLKAEAEKRIEEILSDVFCA
jgi:type I restriction-modification system DNA methylase subunit/restriction endonuclease S subunit